MTTRMLKKINAFLELKLAPMRERRARAKRAFDVQIFMMEVARELPSHKGIIARIEAVKDELAPKPKAGLVARWNNYWEREEIERWCYERMNEITREEEKL